MNLIVNGKRRTLQSSTVAAMLTELGLDERKVAIEHNLEIVPRSQYGATLVAEGDSLEIVHFIGGG